METLIDLAIVVFVFTAAWVIRRLTRDDDTQQPATRVSPRQQFLADLAAYRALRDNGIEQQPGDPYSDTRIEAELLFIPTQRQPRKEQP